MRMKGKRAAQGHERFMRSALTLARKGLGKTSPNPAVGAVLVKDGKIIAGGYHRKAGLPHAEIEAMRKAGWIGEGRTGRGGRAGLNGATLYVTLEPCRHFGRTPPCTDAIISSGIKRVVIGAVDPNPDVRGTAIKRLRSAGLDVVTGVLQDECSALNAPYNKYITSRMPYVTVKLASSLDGRIAAKTGESRWITGEGARREVQRIRTKADAIMAGVNTVLKDDPSLTVRTPGRRENPARAVVDTHFRTPLKAKVFRNAGKDRVIVFTSRDTGAEKIKKAEALGVTVVKVRKAEGGEGGVSLKEALRALGGLGIINVLVEGGGRLAASLIKEGLADRLLLFMAPVIIGADGVPSIGELGIKRLKTAPRLENVILRKIGDDYLFDGSF